MTPNQETKVRKKPCAHCLFTKRHLGNKAHITEIRGRADQLSRPFLCHEHSENVVCCMYARRHPEMIQKPIETVQESGDRRHFFSNLTRKEMDGYDL